MGSPIGLKRGRRRDAIRPEIRSHERSLEGIGLGGDFDSLISLIETTIHSDQWESLGGSSTMSPAPGNRPGLVVSTTYQTHRQIEQLLQALRENSFGLDAVHRRVAR